MPHGFSDWITHFSASRSLCSKSLRKSKAGIQQPQEESLVIPSPSSLPERSGHLSLPERPCEVQLTPTRRVNKPPAPPPPPQPPGRPLPPPPPPTPPPTEQDHGTDDPELSTLASASLDGAAVLAAEHSSQCSSPELPLPPPPSTSETEVTPSDDPLPPPPLDLPDVDLNARPPLQSIVVYPKNSYMSYRNERRMGRQKYDGSYHARSPVELDPDSFSSKNGTGQAESGLSNLSSISWERLHNIRQQGTTLVFHSDSIKFKSACATQYACEILPSHGDGTHTVQSPDLQTASRNSCSSLCSTKLDTVTRAADSNGSSLNVSCASCLNELLLKEHSQVNVICSIHKTHGAWTKTTVQSETKDARGFRVDLDDVHTPQLNGTDYSNTVNQSKHTLSRDISSEKNRDALSSQLNRNSETADTVIGEDAGAWTKGVSRTVQKPKSREELECERLSEDFVNHCKDSVLKSLLVMSPNHKTVSDYMQGLLDLQPEGNLKVHHLDPASMTRNNNYNFVCKTTISIPLEKKREEKVLPANSAYFTTSEPKAKLLTRYGQDMGKQEWSSETELNKKKEELIGSITRKLDIMRAEQVMLREEKAQNEVLGNEVTLRVQELAKPNELEKYHLHIEEMEKIINLLLSISGRLARVQNALMSLGKDANEEERRVLEAKRDKLSSQHEEARRLKESIDRRSQYVSSILHRILSDDEYADYDHFVKMKSKLLMDAREIDEKIKLGEEQLAALRNSAGICLAKGIFGAS